MAHSIITVATMKGGSGKSTLASCLAVHWQINGHRSAIIDADPQRTIARLATREKALGGVNVIEDATDDACKAAQRLMKTHDAVIIDTPGFRSQAIRFTIRNSVMRRNFISSMSFSSTRTLIAVYARRCFCRPTTDAAPSLRKRRQSSQRSRHNDQPR